jgi:uncharacterized protein (TIGR02246 family)
MKLSLLAAVGLATGISGLALAQGKNGPCTGPEEACQQIARIVKDFDAAFNRQDAAAVAALYTEDAILAPEGPILSGRDAIEKFYAGAFKAGLSNAVTNTKETHIIGDIAWVVGDWSAMGPGPNHTTQRYHGNWVGLYVHSGGAWKARLDSSNVIETSQ